MNKFSWYEAKSIEDALQQVNSTVSNELVKPGKEAAIFKSGGVEVMDWMKEGLLNPKMIINIRNIPDMDVISFNPIDGIKIGANATLADIGEDEYIKEHYAALHEAIHHAATPQLRNMSTLGGNITQRNRCWYYRSSDHPCFRKGGDRCYARRPDSGQNENHAILDNGSCVSVHASSIATALMAYDAKVHITDSEGNKKVVAIDEFFVRASVDPHNENILKPKEIITEITLPVTLPQTKTHYIKHVARESYDWSLGDVAVVALMNGNTVKSVKIILGAAAPTPYRAESAENALTGKEINQATAQNAAALAMESARPLSQNEYKIPMFVNLIKHAILNLS